MNSGKYVFAQLMSFLPVKEFHKCVDRYSGSRKVKSFSCMDQFLCMAFAQLTHRRSLRDLQESLRSQQSKLYHLGFRSVISRNTLANANGIRDWRIYSDFAQILIGKARKLYADEDLGLDLQNTVYALDSTTIDLCLNSFFWASYRKTKAAIKLHTLLDLRGSIPVFINISEGRLHDVNILDEIIMEPGSFYVMDRGYLDYARLFNIDQSSAFFVIRSKSNTVFKRLYSDQVDKEEGLMCDQIGVLKNKKTYNDYPQKIRRIKFFDKKTQKTYVYLTNHLKLPALSIAKLYKSRWEVELFFKWIKQHLRIQKFYGRSPNAVKTQIWTAISTYLLIAIIKKELNITQSLYTFLQVLGINLFSKTPINQLFPEARLQKLKPQNPNQLFLFN